MNNFFNILIGASAEGQAVADIRTAINGDLSPSALDQMQVFTDDNIAIRGTTAYWFYTANGQGTPSFDIDQIFFATKDLTIDTDFSQGWVRYNGGSGDAIAVLPPQGSGWEERQTFCRQIIDDAGTFKMWYVGHAASPSPTTFQVGYATSSDGITWSRSGSNPIYTNSVEFGTTGVIRFCVYKEGASSYHAYASGDGNIDSIGAIYLTSSDGITWAEQNTGLFIGQGLRWIHAIRKSGSTYYVYCSIGNNPNYYLNGTATTLTIYSTTDFISLTKISDIHSKTEPQEAGMIGGSIFEYDNKYYWGYHYSKNQVKYNGNNGEPFTALKVIESNIPFHNAPAVSIEYPSYLKRYYPGYELPETQSPLERITGESPIVTGTLSWSKMRYVEFDGSQLITYPEYVPADTKLFATKARVGVGAGLNAHIIRQDNPSGVRGWIMYISTGKLRVIMRNAAGDIRLDYITTTDIVKPPGVYDENDEASAGFIFNNGQLDLLFGDGIQAVTKNVDLGLTDIYTGGNDVELGANGAINVIRSWCIFDTITESQWLNVIDL